MAAGAKGDMSNEAEFLRTPVQCAIHGPQHVARFLMPRAGDFFAAHYVCALCADNTDIATEPAKQEA